MTRAIAIRRTLFSFVLVLGGAVTLSDCLVDGRCFVSSDCPAQQICNSEGLCIYECSRDADCGGGLVCANHQCRVSNSNTGAGGSPMKPPEIGGTSLGGSTSDLPDAAVNPTSAALPHDAEGAVQAPPSCPADMVNIGDSFCIDRFEASRPDATEKSFGTDPRQAVSRQGVMPWQLASTSTESATALLACQNAQKELCTSMQWLIACRGAGQTNYTYGDSYNPSACNGIDLFGRSAFHLLPTGSLETCKNTWGVYDLNGNLWEHVQSGGPEGVRGGAYNCSDSAALHRCEYVPGDWVPSARGFRCCKGLR